MTSSTETFQISVAAAEIYESKFVPAFFAEWAPHLVDLADIGPGQAILDVACGTASSRARPPIAWPGRGGSSEWTSTRPC